MTKIDISLPAGIVMFLAAIALMEAVACYGHKHVMHGWAWFLHKSHHEPRHGWFEKNDWFAVLGAAVAITLFWLGGRAGYGNFFLWLASGITAYGALYFLIHDIYVHQRLPFVRSPRSAYMKRILQAHRLHHVIESKDGSVSFGFLWAPPVRQLKQQLAVTIASGDARLRDTAMARLHMTETQLPPAGDLPDNKGGNRP